MMALVIRKRKLPLHPLWLDCNCCHLSLWPEALLVFQQQQQVLVEHLPFWRLENHACIGRKLMYNVVCKKKRLYDAMYTLWSSFSCRSFLSLSALAVLNRELMFFLRERFTLLTFSNSDFNWLFCWSKWNSFCSRSSTLASNWNFPKNEH